MTETVREVLTRAARKVALASEGKVAPEAYDIENLKDILFAWYEGSINGGLFGALVDVAKDAAYTAEEFERVRKDAAVTITIPDTITDDETGEDRPPLDLCPIVVTYPGQAGYPQLHIYDADIGDWTRLDTLTLDSDAPLSGRGADGLACVVAVQAMEEYGFAPGRLTIARAARFRFALLTRFASARRPVAYEFY